MTLPQRCRNVVCLLGTYSFAKFLLEEEMGSKDVMKSIFERIREYEQVEFQTVTHKSTHYMLE